MADEQITAEEQEIARRELTPERFDDLELAIVYSEMPAVELPLVHRFTPGLYAREIFMPAGTLVTSKIHKTEHPYVVTKGRVSVYIPGVGIQHISAPHVGITKPGTRRLLYIHEDCTWITFHPLVEGESDESDLDKIEARIIETRLLPDGRRAFDHYQDKLAAQAKAELGPAHDCEEDEK